MPELPEVEVVRRGLATHIAGRTIADVEVLHPRAVRKNIGEFAVAGRTFATPKRRGKYLWLPFTDDSAIIAHLGMSGQFRVEAPGADRHKHSRVVFHLDDTDLHFVDQRTFGSVTFSPAAPVPDLIRHIALDPFDADFDLDQVAATMSTKSRAIKRLLLDQSLVSGIGNIYADEALWRAGIHGETLGTALSPTRLSALLQAATEVMRDSLAQGGTSFDELYVNINGESGYFERALAAYGREDRPCPRCSTPIRRERFMNRSSFSCPSCQPIE